MAKKFEHPFECAECSEHPKKDFTFFKPVDDWFIAYPDKKLVHIHFGVATHNDEENIAEVKALREYLFNLVKKYPKKNLFAVVDCSRSDDSEFVPAESVKIYKEIISHPQLHSGALYGATKAFNFFMNLLISATGKDIKLVKTKAEADKDYQNWLNA